MPVQLMLIVFQTDVDRTDRRLFFPRRRTEITMHSAAAGHPKKQQEKLQQQSGRATQHRMKQPMPANALGQGCYQVRNLDFWQEKIEKEKVRIESESVQICSLTEIKLFVRLMHLSQTSYCDISNMTQNSKSPNTCQQQLWKKLLL